MYMKKLIKIKNKVKSIAFNSMLYNMTVLFLKSFLSCPSMKHLRSFIKYYTYYLKGMINVWQLYLKFGKITMTFKVFKSF